MYGSQEQTMPDISNRHLMLYTICTERTSGCFQFLYADTLDELSPLTSLCTSVSTVN